MPSFGSRGISYTPYFAEAMEGIGEAFAGRREKARQREEGALAEKAFMGDPIALQELTAMNPELARQTEDQAMQRKTTEQTNRMAVDTAFTEDVDRLIMQIGAFPDYESAREYGTRMTEQLKAKYPERAQGQPEFTEETFKQLKTIADQEKAAKGTGWETVGSPYQVEHPTTGEPATAVIVQDPQGNTYEKLMEGVNGESLTRLSQYDVDLRGDIAEEQARRKELGQTAEQRAQTAIDAGVAAATALPDVNRSLDLLTQLEGMDQDTAGWRELVLKGQQWLGWEGEGTADQAELQQLLATQMFDVLSNFRGAISNQELNTARELSTGLGKNIEANRRILKVLQQRLGRAIDLAKTSAQERGDVTALAMLENFDPYAASEMPQTTLPAAKVPKQIAPQAAIDMLLADPSPEAIAEFSELFGYIPEEVQGAAGG